MTDIARLGIAIDSSAAQTAADRLRSLTGAGARAETQMSSLGSRTRRLSSDMGQVSTSSQRVASAISTFGRALQGLALAETARRLISVADGYALMNARLGLVTNGSEQLARVQANLFKQAQNNRQGLGETTNLYTSLARATKDVGVSEQDLLKVTDAVGKSLLISGTSSQEASGALRQLGQAFASGTLRGDEFNSVNEQMPRLMEAIAKGMNRTVGEMRNMAAAGELTTQSMIPAMIASLGELNREAAKMPQTFDQAMTQLGNSLTLSIGKVNEAYNLTGRLARGVETFAKITVDPGLLANKLGLDELADLERKSQRYRDQIDKTIDEIEKYKKSSGENPSPAQIQHMEAMRAKASQLSNQLRDTNQQIKDFANQKDPTGGPAPEQSGDDLRLRNFQQQANAARQAGLAWDALTKKYQAPADKFKEVAAEIRKTGEAAGESEAKIRKLIEAARPKSAGGGGGAASKAMREAEAAAKRLAALDLKLSTRDLSADIGDIQRAMTDLVSDYQNQTDRLEALRQAGLVDEQEYFETRRELVLADNRVRQAALQKEYDRLEEEKRIAAERRDAAGDKGTERLEAERRYNAEIINLNSQQADSLSEIERLRLQTGVATENLKTQEQAQARRRILDTEALRQSAEQYLETTKAQYDLEIESMGKGQQARERLKGLAQINERYQQQLLDATRERAAAQTKEQKEQLDQQIQIIQEFREKALTEYDIYWQRLQDKQRDAASGAREAIANYIDDANNLARQTEGMFTNAFTGLEDAVVDATETGKLSFSNMLKQMQADMARFFVKQTVSKLLQLMGGTGGSSAFGTAGNQAIANQVFAKGGTFLNGINSLSSGVYSSPRLFRFASGMGLMAEAGPEAVMPLKRGRDGKLGVTVDGGMGGPMNNTFNVNMPSGNSNQPSPMEMKRILTTAVERAMANKQRRSTR